MTVPWLSSSSSIRQSWWCFSQTILQHAAWSTIVCSARQLHVHWDIIKEDIYVWAIMPHHHNTSTSQFQSNTSTFHDQLPIYQPVLGPYQPSQAKWLHRIRHTLQKAKKSASSTVRDAAQGGKNASSHTSAGTQAARVSTLAKVCVKCPWAPATSHPPNFR